MDVHAVEGVLADILEKIPGLHGVLLITDDGFPIVSTLQAGETETKSTAVGAILCESGERGIGELDLGSMDAVVTIGDDGFFVVRRVAKEMLLMAVAPHDVLLGNALLRIRRAVPRLIECLQGS
jgi:predicted regulator of Ras-like GTPase activity (Roadblock/LC7/MglB family)